MPTEEERRLLEDLRARLGLGPAPSQEQSLFGKITQPVRSFFGAAGAIGGRGLGYLDPQAYQRAMEENRQSFGLGSDPGLMKQVEALPGAGDVAAQMVPEAVRESTMGQAVGPFGRMVGNIAGDPTTYTPFVAGRLGGLALKGMPKAAAAARSADAVNKALKARHQAQALAPDLMRKAAKYGEERIWKAVTEHGGAKAAAYKAAEVIRRGEPYTLGSAAAIAYGPDVLGAATQGARAVAEAETIPEGIAAGVNTSLMAGMAVLMGKGLISTGRAVRTLSEDMGRRTALTPDETGEIGRILRGEPDPMDPSRMIEAGGEPAIPMGPEDAIAREPGPVEEVGEAIGRPYPDEAAAALPVDIEVGTPDAPRLGGVEPIYRVGEEAPRPESGFDPVPEQPALGPEAPLTPISEGLPAPASPEGVPGAPERSPLEIADVPIDELALAKGRLRAAGTFVPDWVQTEDDLVRLMREAGASNDEIQGVLVGPDVGPGGAAPRAGAPERTPLAPDEPPGSTPPISETPRVEEGTPTGEPVVSDTPTEDFTTPEPVVEPTDAGRYGGIEENEALVEGIGKWLESKSDRRKGRAPSPEVRERFLDMIDSDPEFQARLAKMAEGAENYGQVMPILRKVGAQIQDQIDMEKEVGITREAPAVKATEAARERGELPGGAGGDIGGKRRVAEGGKLTKEQARQQAYESARDIADAGGTDLPKAAEALKGMRFKAMGKERVLTGDNLSRLQRYFTLRGEGLKRVDAFQQIANESGVSRRTIQNTIGAAENAVYERLTEAAAGTEAVATRKAAAPRKGTAGTLERLRGRRRQLAEQAPKRKEGQSTAEFAGEIDRHAELDRWVEEVEAQGEAAAKGLGRQIPIKGPRQVATELRAEPRKGAGMLDVAHKAVAKLMALQNAPEAEVRAALKRIDEAWKRGREKVTARAPASIPEGAAPAATAFAGVSGQRAQGLAKFLAAEARKQTDDITANVEDLAKIVGSKKKAAEVLGAIFEGKHPRYVARIVPPPLGEIRKAVDIPSRSDPGTTVKAYRFGISERKAPTAAAVGDVAATRKLSRFKPLKVRGRAEQGVWVGEGGTRINLAEENAKLISVPEDSRKLRSDVQAMLDDEGITLIDVEDVKHPELNKMSRSLPKGWKRAVAGDERDVFVREGGPRARRIEGMSAREMPANFADAALRQDDGRPSEMNTRMVMGMLGDDASVTPQVSGRLQALNVKLDDPSDSFDLIGRGAFHNVFEIKGSGPRGERYVMRVGKAPFMGLPTAEQRQFVQQPVGEPGRLTTLGEEFNYTIHRRGIAPTVALEMDKLDIHGDLRERFDLLPVGVSGDLFNYMDVETFMQRRGQLPPGVSLGDHLQDQVDLYEGAKLAGLGIDDYVQENLASGIQHVRANQTIYVPLGPNDAKNGVIRRGGDGTDYKLVFSDYGTIYPKHPPAGSPWHSMNHVQRLMLKDSLPGSALTGSEYVQRAGQYAVDAEQGLSIKGESGLKVVNHDRLAAAGYVGRVGDTLGPAAGVLRQITDDLAGLVNSRLGKGMKPLKVRYAGMTASPHLSGLYDDGNIFSNVVEAVHAGSSYDDAVDKSLFTLIHEIAHNDGIGHDATHQTLSEYIMHLAAAEGRIDEYRKMLKAAMPETTYRQVMDDLVPEFITQRKWHGESWRTAEGVPRVPDGDTAGRVATEPGRGGRGAEGPPGGRGDGVQRGGDVPGGGRGQAEQLRARAAAQERPAGRPAEGEAVRQRAGRGAQEEAGGYPGIVRRIEEYHAKGVTLESAHKDMDDLLAAVPASRPVNGVLDHAYNLAAQIEQAMPEAAIQKALGEGILPSPRRKGQVRGPINFTHLPDVPDRLKVRAMMWEQLSEKAWKRSKTETWDSVSGEVQDMLGLHTPEEWALMVKRAKRPLKTQDVFILQEIHNEMAGRVGRAETRWADAAAAGADEAKLKGALWKEVDEARRVYQHTAHTLAETMTGFARGLAAGRRTVRALDPRLQWEQDMLAGLRERLSTEIRDKTEREQVARDLFQKLLKVQEEGGDWDGFYKALRMIHKNPVRRGRDMALEWYKAGLIGVPSRVANITSNVLFRKVRYLEDAVAAGLDFVRSKLTGQEREIYIGEAAVAWMAMKRGYREALPKWLRDFKSALLLEPEDMEQLLAKGGIAEDLMHMGGAIPGKLGSLIRFHLRGLGADDHLAKHISTNDTYYREVYRRIRKGETFFKKQAGESNAAATERIVNDLVDNFDKARRGEKFDSLKQELFDPIQKKAVGLARDDTFQKQLGPGMQNIQKTLRGPAWALQTVFPFVRTPTNIFFETLKRTPLGFFDVYSKWKGLNQADKLTAMSKPLTGTMIGLFFLSEALDGDISGGGPINPDEREALMSTGWQPYSRRVEVDGKTHWVAYNRLEPVASIIGMAGDMAEAMRQGDHKQWQSLVERVLKSSAENMTNKTLLVGLDSMLAAASHPKQFMPRFVRQMQSSVIPNSIGFIPFGHLARAIDPIYRSTDAFSSDVFWSKVPFASQSLDAQYGPTGETRLRPGTFGERLILPFARRTEEVGIKADAAHEMVRLQAAPRAPAREWISPQGYRIKYTKEERALMAKALDQATQVIGQRLVKDPNYQRLPDTELDVRYRYGQKTKKDVVENLIQRYRRRALSRIRPGLQRRARQEYRVRREEG